MDQAHQSITHTAVLGHALARQSTGVHWASPANSVELPGVPLDGRRHLTRTPNRHAPHETAYPRFLGAVIRT